VRADPDVELVWQFVDAEKRARYLEAAAAGVLAYLEAIAD